MGLRDTIAHGWNMFRNRDETEKVASTPAGSFAVSSSSGASRPDRTRLSYSTDKSMISSIYTRISIDAAAIPIRHVRLDENDRYLSTIKTSGLNYCLTKEANLDQAARQFRQDLFLTMCDVGVIAAVPIDYTSDPTISGYDIQTMRIGTVTQWWSEHVRVSIWRQDKQIREEVIVPKADVAIVENPLYSIMNSPNSTLQRLTRKLNLLDAIDEQSSSGKLDLIVQLPYNVRSETRKDQAELRRKALEDQMKDSRYGIGYIGIEEKITQLNRPAENNMLAQVEFLTNMLYSQLGLTPSIFDGTASEEEMLNYHNRTIDAFLTAVCEEFARKFLTKTARTQGQSVEYYRNPFKYVPLSKFSELADKLTRNEIASSNDMRAEIGWSPSKDPKANQLLNKNLPQPIDPSASEDPVDLVQATEVPDPRTLAIER